MKRGGHLPQTLITPNSILKVMAEKGGTKILKRKSVIILVISIVIVLILFWRIASQLFITIRFATSEDVKLTISTAKEIINKTENKSFMVNIKLINVADENLFVLHDFSINGLLEFNITIPSNNTIFPRHPQVDFTSRKIFKNHISLTPDESIDITLDIFDYEYSVGQRGGDTGLYDWNETGKYEIQFEYDNYQRGEIIKSNIIEFWLKN